MIAVFLDIDECATGVAKCDPNAFCKNVDGSYECECKRGYNGDGQTCFGKFSEISNKNYRYHRSECF